MRAKLILRYCERKHARKTDTLRAQKEVDKSSPRKGNMHTNSPRETGVRRYRIIVGSYKIGKLTKWKRVKEKRAEREPRQNESRQSETRQTDARQSKTRQCGMTPYYVLNNLQATLHFAQKQWAVGNCLFLKMLGF